MHNFKNARKFYLTPNGIRMLLLALPIIGYVATLVSDATLADGPVSRNGARGVRCLAEMGAVPGRKA